MANSKFISWVKAHKFASSAIGCGGLIVLGFIFILVLGLILIATGNVPEEEVAAESPTSEAPKTSTAPKTTEAPKPSAPPTTNTPKPTKSETAKPAPKKTEKPKKTKAPKPKPKTESIEDRIKKVRSDAQTHTEGENDEYLFVELEAADPLLKITDQGDTLDILKAYKASGMKQKQITITGTFDTAMAFNVTYEKATVERLDLDNTAISTIWDQADREFIHDQWK